MERILLGQLGAKGDSLYATILARQLRHDYPDAEITWAIFDQNADLLLNNPHIDVVWKVPQGNAQDSILMWSVFEQEAVRRFVRREFDRVVLSQIHPNNFQNYDGTVRPCILRAYGAPITVPIENVIELTDDEIARVEMFARESKLDRFEHRVLFECSSRSGQSFMTPDLAQEVAARLYEKLPDVTVIFNTHLPMELKDERSRYAGTLSLREMAHLTKHCSLFVGAGSGGTVSATSTAACALPMIQLLEKSTSVFGSFAHDFEYFDIKDRPILEMTDEDPEHIAVCITAMCRGEVEAAFARFNGRIEVTFDQYFRNISRMLLRELRFVDAARSLMITAHRYGWTSDLIDFGAKEIVPSLKLDPSWLFHSNRLVGEKLRAQIEEARKHPAPFPQQGLWRDENVRAR